MARSPVQSKSNLTAEALEEPISEQDEWVRNELAKLWGDDIADYFVNSKIDFLEAKANDEQEHEDKTMPSSSVSKPKKKHYPGLYAHQLWHSIREDSSNRLKPFDLNQELQKINYYDKVKTTMDAYVRNELFNKSKKIAKLIRNEDELTRGKNVLDMKRVKEIKSLRNEVELMYRSSKMNEEKFGVLRADSPIPDLNDKDGKEGVCRYLPPLAIKQSPTRLKVDSKLEFITSPLMRDKYRERLEQKLYEEKNKVISTMIENSVLNKQMEGYQPVRMVFLTEENAADPDWRASAFDQADNDKVIQAATRPASNSSPKDDALDELKAKRAQVYPPLTMNALMEYKQVMRGPGVGDFKNGKPSMFKFPKTSS